MSKKEYSLSLSTSQNGEEICLHADSDGLTYLINELEALRSSLIEKEEAPHTHLFSESWGANNLTESMLQSEKEQDHRQVHHVKLYAWSNKWKKKHGL